MAIFHGEEYSAIVGWLCEDWWNSGSGICVIEGFSGVGKTRLVEEVEKRLQQTKGVLTVWSECPETRTGLIDDLILVLAESFSAIGDDRLAETLDTNIIPILLARSRLLVIDEFQRSLVSGSGRPEPGFARWLAKIAGHQGRVILLSNQDIDQGRWSERFAIRRLNGLLPNEGANLLLSFMEDEGLSGKEIPVDRLEEIVKWLGGLPRALHLLVSRLHFESIDDIIGFEPEAWECRNRDVSPDFLRRFEEELLSRSRSDLGENVNRFFERLAVYRRPVDRHALKESNQGFGNVDELRDVLIRRFMLHRRRQFFSMHPVLRETVLSQMDEEVQKSAHRMAGEHYARHFKSQQIVGPSAKLGAEFIEARYHLSQGKDIENLKFVVQKFENHIRAHYGWDTPLPDERDEIDERISLLLALLHVPGAKGLHYYLARLLARRGASGDLELAVKHAKQGTGTKSPASAWLFRMRVEERFNGSKAAIAVAQDGIGKIPPTQNLFALYQACGELLARDNRVSEAIELLKDGIGKIPPTQNLFALYHACGELLARDNRVSEAIELLKDGIGKIPPTQNLYDLYQACGELLARDNRVSEAIELLKDGIGKIPPTQNRHKLVESAILISAAMRRGDWIDTFIAATGKQQLSPTEGLFAEVIRIQVDGDWIAAAEKASFRDHVRVDYFPLYCQEAFSWLCADYPEKARAALERFPHSVEHGRSTPATWLACYIALRCKDIAVACELYSIYTGLTELSGAKLCPSEADLLRIWDSPMLLSAPHPAFYYPTLPPSLTGLNQTVSRVLQFESVLTTQLPLENKRNPEITAVSTIASPIIQKQGGVLSISTEWFSRNGGISTFNRELCVSLARNGQRVVCLVPTASYDEVKAAKESGVQLITAPSTNVSESATALLRRPHLPEGFVPTIIIGHGRITGPFAETQVTDNYQEAKRVHFVHMIPSEIEWYKGKDDAAKTAEERERLEMKLCRNASLVAAVGPRITREIATLIHGLESPPKLHCFNPGILSASPATSVPPGIQCLLLGRAEDLELKGLDIAAKALAELPHPHPRPFESDPALIIRGAPEGTGSRLRKQLIDIAEKQIEVRVREYTPEVEYIYEDLRRASVLLMPSRVEGYGLVASEAVGFGIPILVSDRSGFGELLSEHLPQTKAVNFVVRTTGDLRTDAHEWSRALEGVLRDREAAFSRARDLLDLLSRELSWDAASSELLSACGV